MYKDYFGLAEVPFSIAPDPRYLFMSAGHREALAHLLYGIQGDGGFVLLTGEVGTGKTTVCRCLMEQTPQDCDLALILNPRLSVLELLSTLCDEFHIRYPAETRSIKTFVDLINGFLLKSHAANRKAVLIIDEAQNLRVDVLEQMRLLTNLETNQRKLLQIIMIGQPELRLMLARPELRQVSQRIVARYHLGPLSMAEVEEYVLHRLAVAGAKTQLFDPKLFGLIYSLSGGIPRLINLLCDRALLGAYAQGLKCVDRKTLLQGAQEIFGEENSSFTTTPARRRAKTAAVVLFVMLGLTGLFWGEVSRRASSPPASNFGENASSLRRSLPAIATATREIQEIEPAKEPQPERDQSLGDALLQKVADAGSHIDELSAFEILFQLWGKKLDVSRTSNPCRQARQQGLSCFSGRGSMDELRRLNRPAVLKLYSPDNTAFHVTLGSLKDEEGRILLKDMDFPVSTDILARWWRGEYQLLWEPPPSYNGILRPGESGPAVQWLWNQLARLRGEEPTSAAPVTYDQSLADEVRKFQILSGLQPDGIAGPQTLIYLNARLPGASPILNE